MLYYHFKRHNITDSHFFILLMFLGIIVFLLDLNFDCACTKIMITFRFNYLYNLISVHNGMLTDIIHGSMIYGTTKFLRILYSQNEEIVWHISIT